MPDDGSIVIIVENGPLCDDTEIVVDITSVAKGCGNNFFDQHVLSYKNLKYIVNFFFSKFCAT